MADWQSMPVEFPVFAVLGASRGEGAIAVDARDDMTVRPDRLDATDAAERRRETQVWPCRCDHHAGLSLRRIEVRGQRWWSSGPTAADGPDVSFLRVDRDALNCHYELIYTVEEARTAGLLLVARRHAGVAVDHGARRREVKEYSSEPVAGAAGTCCWPSRGAAASAWPSISNSRCRAGAEGLRLPFVVAEGVAYQSGLVAVEGCAELEVQVDTSARPVDVGELAEADYEPGRRLLGAYGFVGDPPVVKIDVLRHPGYRLYPAIVEQCELDTNLSPEGKPDASAVQAPHEGGLSASEAAARGGVVVGRVGRRAAEAAAGRRSRAGDLPAGTADAAQTLQIVYAAPLGAVTLRGTVASSPRSCSSAPRRASLVPPNPVGRSRLAFAPSRRLRSRSGRRHRRHR